MSIDETRKIRQNNFIYLVSKYESRAEYAEKLGYPNANYITQLIGGHVGIGNRNASKIEEIEGLEEGWLSIPHRDLWREIQITSSLDITDLASLSNSELAEVLDGISSVLKARALKE